MAAITTEVGIYKRKQESKKTRKKEKRTRPRKRSRKKENMNSTKKVIKSFSCFLDRFLGRVLFSFFLVFFYKFPPLFSISIWSRCFFDMNKGDSSGINYFIRSSAKSGQPLYNPHSHCPSVPSHLQHGPESPCLLELLSLDLLKLHLQYRKQSLPLPGRSCRTWPCPAPARPSRCYRPCSRHTPRRLPSPLEVKTENELWN